MPFEPGPGPGGHCIPIDPQYLAWAARKAGKVSEFVELATRLHQAQPLKVVEEIREAVGGDLTDKKVLLLGIAYKPGVASTCESPALVIAHELTRQGALVSFSDPFVRRAPSEHASDFVNDHALPLDGEVLRTQDVCVLVTNHMEFDYELVVEAADRLVDTRGAISSS
jgi:UDP-N-acetyl-D-glucosamine dehydrogenase